MEIFLALSDDMVLVDETRVSVKRKLELWRETLY
jgi:hypothetical protein